MNNFWVQTHFKFRLKNTHFFERKYDSFLDPQSPQIEIKKHSFFNENMCHFWINNYIVFSIYKQTKSRNETGSNLSLSTRLTVLSKRLGHKRCCDATTDRCLGGVPSHYLRFAL